MNDALATLPRVGRLAVIDLVRCPTLEARLAFPTLIEDVVRRVGGRLTFGGSIDQQLCGHGLEDFDDVLISEFPTAEACVRALAMRSEWRPETFVTEIASFATRPWSGWQRFALRGVFAAQRLRGGAPTEARGDAPPAIYEMVSGSPVDPDEEQLAALLEADREGSVVMLNFLRYRTTTEAADGSPQSGASAYAAYGRVSASLIGRLGGRIRYMGRSVRALTGGPEAPWDAFVAVEYPSRAAFIGMLADPRYRAASPLRDAGLDSTRLLVCTAHAAFH